MFRFLTEQNNMSNSITTINPHTIETQSASQTTQGVEASKAGSSTESSTRSTQSGTIAKEKSNIAFQIDFVVPILGKFPTNTPC